MKLVTLWTNLTFIERNYLNVCRFTKVLYFSVIKLIELGENSLMQKKMFKFAKFFKKFYKSKLNLF